ncbi:MAG: hypothetical protein RPU61_03470 [Candidatus Sedimenticola sp. (ex Thyasira tokunagai)]
MGKNLANLRFGVKRTDDYISSLWRLWATKHGDVYLTSKGMGGIHKYSFHQSKICRSAFTSEHGTPASMEDRAIFKWHRNTTPKNTDDAIRVAWIAIPTDYLSKETEPERKKVHWIEAAPEGGATYIELAYTQKEENEVRKLLRSDGDRNLLSYTKLPKDESLLVMHYHSDWENKDLTVPAAKGSIFPDLIFSSEDKNNTGRPIRIKFGPEPKDGDSLVLQELGGYKVD